MTNHDDHEVPDVTVSGTLALELTDLLVWASRAPFLESAERAGVRDTLRALDAECMRSWGQQTGERT